MESYNYDRIISDKIPNYTRYYAIISFICTSDTQCLTNKCIDGYCMFNIENSTEFLGEICKTNKECASVKCLRNGYCYAPPNRPSDSDGIYDIFEFFVYFCTLCIITPIKENKDKKGTCMNYMIDTILTKVCTYVKCEFRRKI
ncbi:hypothetical protein H8356DRAFT_1329707 [Neocallimastix lanati (nom. inval.)]|nr:hypothetical protein H8356DRAFT_1329707 [Neocallimastix sp. JGI-2020a]